MYKLLFNYVKNVFSGQENCPFLSESIWNATAIPDLLQWSSLKLERKQKTCPQNSIKFIKNVPYRSKKQQTESEATIYYKYFISIRRYNLSGFS